MAHFEVVEVTYVDGSVERVPAEAMASMSGDRSDTAYLVSFTVGVPTALLMVFLAFGGGGGVGVVFGPAALVLAASSGLGCALAVAGVRSPARRFRVAALALTLIPGIVVIAYGAALVAFIMIFLGSGNPNS